MNKALIFGITGQDGSYLAEYLLELGYEVHGVVRRSSINNTTRLTNIYDKLILYYGDLTDSLSIDNAVRLSAPDLIFNLAAQSHVKVSFDVPEYTGEVDAMGTLRILEAVRKYCPESRYYQASTSELYGLVQETPQKETTPFHPRSPYGIAKLYSYWICKNYREAYNIKTFNGILFNHESERRGETFVTRKITLGLSRIQNKIMLNQDFNSIKLGNIYASRDWGHAEDYVKGMYKIITSDIPDDYILSTFETHTIKEFITEACKYTDINLVWSGEGVNEKGIDTNTNKVIIEIDEKYYRPAEVDLLIGDNTKAKIKLGWSPEISFEKLVERMMKYDLSKSGE